MDIGFRTGLIHCVGCPVPGAVGWGNYGRLKGDQRFNYPVDPVVKEGWAQMEAADDSMHLGDAGDRLSVVNGIDNASVTATGEYHQPLAPKVYYQALVVTD